MRRKLILAVLILLAFVLQGTVFQDTVHCFDRSESAADSHSILWIYEGKEGRAVRRIFLWTADRYFLWKYDWILCPNLYVYRFWKRFSV